MLLEYFNAHPAEYDILRVVHKIELKSSGVSDFKPLTESDVIRDFTSVCTFMGKQPATMPEPVKDHIRWAEDFKKQIENRRAN